MTLGFFLIDTSKYNACKKPCVTTLAGVTKLPLLVLLTFAKKRCWQSNPLNFYKNKDFMFVLGVPDSSFIFIRCMYAGRKTNPEKSVYKS